MAAALTTALTTYLQQRHDNYVSLKKESQVDFTAANDELKTALKDHESLVAQFSALESSISTKRGKMSASDIMPSDIETLAQELRQLLIDRRHKIAAISDAAESLNDAETAVIAAELQLKVSKNQLDAAAKELEVASKRGSLHATWVSGETEDAIEEVRVKASKLLAETPIVVEEGEVSPTEVLAAATARIENDIPEVLLKRAKARAISAASKVADFESFKDFIDSSLLSHGASTDGSSGVVAQRWAEYETAENKLKNYALTSVSQYESTLSLLASVVSSNELTQAESKRITKLALAEDAESITTEDTLHSARAAVAAKRLKLELAIIAARVADITKDPAADADVKKEKNELADLETALATAEAEHLTKFAKKIDLWESAIPSAIWANLQAYESAINTLEAISSSDAAALINALNGAEAKLVTAVTKDDNNKKLSEVLGATSVISNQRMKYIRSVQNAVSLSAMRGDY